MFKLAEQGMALLEARRRVGDSPDWGREGLAILSAGDDGDGDDDGGDLIAVMQELRSQCIDYGIKCANWDS
jgi:hypothetical protein